MGQTPTPTPELMLLAQQYNVMFNPSVSGPTATPTATPTTEPGGSWAVTFDTTHDSASGDWEGYGITCTEGSGVLDYTETDQGSCNFTGTGEGNAQPTDDDQWGFMEFGAAVDYVGPMLRSTSGNMATGEFAYAARGSGDSLIEIRVCDGDLNDSDCTTMGEGINPGDDPGEAGDGILFAVAGEGDNTVLCMWAFDVVGATDYCDSANWGLAHICMNDDQTPLSPGSKLDDFINCSTTICLSWGGDGPDQSEKGFPVTTQYNVRAYSGSTASDDFSTHTCGGTL
jgi:hypothetical protein